MSLKISRILHAGYIFECGDTKIVFDPILENPFSKNCYAFPNIAFDFNQVKNLKFSAIFISHFHDDHCSLDSLNLLDRNTPIYLYCMYDELFSMIKDLGFNFVYSLELDISVHIGSIEIIPRRALDADVDSLFQVKAVGLNILNVVDSWIDDATMHQLKKIGNWDIVLWPFQTMREIEVLTPSRSKPASKQLPPEWISQLQILNPRYVVPSSCQFIQENWSWYNQAMFPVSYKQFASELKMALPNSEVVRMNPAVSIILYKESLEVTQSLPWIETIGNQNIDYEYQPFLKPPTTAEIAKNFPALSKAKADKVLLYCRDQILKKYSDLQPSDEVYFNQARLWKLSVYDHQGIASYFYYNISNKKIELAKENDHISWLTEIPAAKLLSALENGEALTSLYIRINDTQFGSELAQEIESVEVIEDPLVRCLFNGNFGSYQKAQLIRIQANKR